MRRETVMSAAKRAGEPSPRSLGTLCSCTPREGVLAAAQKGFVAFTARRRCRFRTNCGRTSDCVPVAVPPSDIHNPPLLWVRSPNPLTQAIRLTASSAPHRLSIQEFPVDGACWPLRFTQHLWHQMACIALAPESVYTTPTSRFAGGVVLSIKARGACAAT